MSSFLLAALAASLAVQTAPVTTPDEAPAPPPITDFEQLPIAEAAAARCAVAFGVVGRWQLQGDERGSAYPDMQNEGGREFFVQTMASLMDDKDMNREDLMRLVESESGKFDDPQGAERIDAMMSACLLMKQSIGL